jgi:hypothetical protein|uniref:Uncharacterized protein n=1 Tax=Bionectria ochroleuca TaxID=29856 RepID=A0A8H7K7M8_BIOOC
MGPGLEQFEGSIDAKQWLKQAKGGKQCWIAIIIGSHLNWVEHKKIDLLEEKHATVVAVINRGNRGGKVMLVWDSDRKATPSRPRSAYEDTHRQRPRQGGLIALLRAVRRPKTSPPAT